MPHIVTFDGLIARQPGFQEPDEFIKLGDIKGGFQADELTGTFDALNEPTNFDDRGLSPISGNGVFNPQDIDAKGSVIWGDNHFTPDRGGDSLTGEGRPMKIWTNGGASTFEDRHVGDHDANDAVFGMRGNIGGQAGPGGTTFMTETFEPAAGMNSFGESLNPLLETAACNGYDCTNAGSCSNPAVLKAMVGGSAGPGGDDL